MAAVSVNSEPKKLDRRRVSCDTLCSSNSSCVLQKRKPLHPLARSVQTRSNNPVAQRVLSAKFLRFKTLQNQLNDANYHIAQLVNENKILKNLQKRQDHALSKYEGQSAQLPQVLVSHQEEIRVLQAKNKTFKAKIKDLTDQLKSKDEELNSIKDQFKHLQSLTKNKNLDEREKLQEKIEELTESLRKSESNVNLLNRKLMLETKNYKYKLNSEISKHKETQKELSKMYEQFRNSKSEKSQSSRNASTDRKSRSTIHLCEKRVPDKMKNEKLSSPNTSSSITNLSEDVVSFNSLSQGPEANLAALERLSSSDIYAADKQLVCYTGTPEEYEDFTSELQLKEMVNNLQIKSTQLDEKIKEEMQLVSSSAIRSAKFSNDIIDKHTAEYQRSIRETEMLIETLKHADAKNDKLVLGKNSKNIPLRDYSLISHKSSNDDLVAHVFKSNKDGNYSFEEDLLSDTSNQLVVIEEPEVDHTDKQKLIATLKAIDNGDSNVETVDNITLIQDMKQAKSDLMKELFG